MSKQFWAVLIVIAAIFIGAVIISGKNNKNDSVAGTPTNHVEGNASSGVKLVEYGDYQCPVCGVYFDTVKQVAAKYSSQVEFQFRNLPLPSLHPNAFAAARAAEAASDQGKFWQMHDLLYQNQNTWSSAPSPMTLFTSYAKTIGLNTIKFKADYASSKTNGAINADVAAFDKTHDEKATPTFYLNGKKVDLGKLVDSKTNTPSVDKFSAVLDAAIVKHAKSSATKN